MKTSFSIPQLIAHRGAKAYAPENTIAALNKAVELGADWIECDVSFDNQAQPIIFHDHNLKRITNLNASTAETPYSVIKTLDAGRFFNADFTGESIPTLAEWLQKAATLRIGINLDIKDYGYFPPQILAKNVLGALSCYWNSTLMLPIISSHSLECLSAFHKYNLTGRLAYIMDRWSSQWEKDINRFNCFSLHVNYRALTQKRIEQIKKQNYLLFVYTINNRTLANRLLSMGVDAIFTDNPLLLS